MDLYRLHLLFQSWLCHLRSCSDYRHLHYWLLKAALHFCRRYSFHLHDLIYGIWAIVSARHTAGSQGRTTFTVAGRNKSLSGQDGEVGLPDRDFLLALTVPGDMDVLSWVRHVGNFSAEASSYTHIGYKQILETASIDPTQVRVSINQEHYGQDVVTAHADFALVKLHSMACWPSPKSQSCVNCSSVIRSSQQHRDPSGQL